MPITISINQPIISDLEPIFSENLDPNLTQTNVAIKVVIHIINAGKYISSVLATREAPTASASMLVAIPRISRDLNPKIFLSTFSSSFSMYHAAIMFHPIYPSRKNAIQ